MGLLYEYLPTAIRVRRKRHTVCTYNDILLLTNRVTICWLFFRCGHLKCTLVPDWKVLHNHIIRNTVHVHRRNVPNRNPTFPTWHMLHVWQDRFNGGTTNSIISKFINKLNIYTQVHTRGMWGIKHGLIV